ncbi:MAG TPA: hypothetical protein VG122_23040 [Gemmata sp.]|jgi:hypothetical protein|nr:hypothetical protein [Gemmata sp.]
MLAPFENAAQTVENRLPIVEVSSGVSGSDGRGIGHLVDAKTIEEWVQEYLTGRTDPIATEPSKLVAAFQFGVQAEGRYAGQSFVEAEPVVRSEWSCERDRLPWESVRDAVWAGFDRARDRTL